MNISFKDHNLHPEINMTVEREKEKEKKKRSNNRLSQMEIPRYLPHKR